MSGSYLTCPTLTTGSYSYNTVLSEGKHILIYFITENSSVGTGVDIGIHLFSLTNTVLSLVGENCSSFKQHVSRLLEDF